ncbi:MAG: calcium-binding protein, partial [Nitrososphaerales archaeon]
GNDTIFGGEGGDTIMGGPTDDLIVGEMGTDIMYGQDGDDKIYHALLNSTTTDGSTDLVVCGDGQDEVWINSSVDGDQASDDCEIIHRG